MTKRTYEQAVVVACGAQASQDRFAKRQRRHDLDDVPPISSWRCNLTGLSQVHNLYFVAYQEKIYVYIPQFSTQALPEQSALIVTSQPTSAGRGTIDPRNPHAINNLVVQLLGIDEVVAVVRDDGDIDAFLVRHICHAIDRRREEGSSISVNADDVRPFFQSNVGLSAWGLAIHSHARIIATSANTHNITIFRFGLVNAGGVDGKQQSNEASTDSSPGRAMDVTQQVLNGTSNIPSIAFCNTGDDPDARWLLTTDISGLCRSIDLRSMQTSKTFRFGPGTGHFGTYNSLFDRAKAGWAIMFLDRRSFIPARSILDALRLVDHRDPSSIGLTSTLWNLDATVIHLPDHSYEFEIQERQTASGEALSRTTTIPDGQGTGGSSSRSVSASGTESASHVSDGEDELLPDADLYPQTNSSALEDASEPDDVWDDSDDLLPSLAGHDKRQIYEPQGVPPHTDICEDNPCPILHASVRAVYLLQPPCRKDPDGPFIAPTIGFADALTQYLPVSYAGLAQFERLNMNAYIPSIGIVVLASQKGRAMILSLTSLSKSVKYPKSMRDPDTVPKTTYAMRIEHTVPFASQEEKSQRPFQPLLGIATGPMQGTEHLPLENKRWRLMMLYADHSILSYEISRPISRDSAVDIQSAVI